MPSDAFHLPLGLVAYLAAALVLRRFRWGPVWALLPVLLLQGLNEALDARDWWRWTGTVPWTEAAIDTAATLGVPVVVAVVWILRRERKN